MLQSIELRISLVGLGRIWSVVQFSSENESEQKSGEKKVRRRGVFLWHFSRSKDEKNNHFFLDFEGESFEHKAFPREDCWERLGLGVEAPMLAPPLPTTSP